MTTVVNISVKELKKSGYDNFADWNKDPNHIYIGRDMSFYVEGATGSIWQNPFPVTKPNKIYKTNKKRYTLDESLEKYKQYLESNEHLKNKLHELKGKVLGCWCKPNRCHGDVLIEFINKYC